MAREPWTRNMVHRVTPGTVNLKAFVRQVKRDAFREFMGYQKKHRRNLSLFAQREILTAKINNKRKGAKQ